MAVFAGYTVIMAASLWGFIYLRKKKKYPQYHKYLLLAAATGGICLLAGILTQQGAQQEGLQGLTRNEAGGGGQAVSLLLDAEGLLEQYAYTIRVEEQLVTDREAEQVFERARQELETVILGENKSLEQVSYDLKLPWQLQNGLVEVSCSFEPYDLVDMDGIIIWDNLKSDTELVLVRAQMSCQGREAIHEFYIQLVLPPLDEPARLLQKISSWIESANQQQGEETLSLPEELDGIRLNWYKEQESSHQKILLLGIVVMAVLYVYEKEKKSKETKEWNQKLILDYPDIVSQLSLLSGAGMTMGAAWAKISAEYREKREEGKITLRPGYEEMMKTWYEIQDGTGEIKAYENFGNRCGQAQYRKLASILMQNVRKGTKGMQELLDGEAREAFRQRKAYAKQLGEEAGTKLLLPMGLMLLLVFAILMIPAMMNLNV